MLDIDQYGLPKIVRNVFRKEEEKCFRKLAKLGLMPIYSKSCLEFSESLYHIDRKARLFAKDLSVIL